MATKKTGSTGKASAKATAGKAEASAAKKAPAKGAAAASTAAAAQPGGPPAAGSAAPAFKLSADDGSVVSLRDFAGKRVVLYFYPKDNTPGCTREACSFQDNLAVIAAKGAVVLGVSRDSTKSHAGFKTKYGLRFPLLSDPDAAVHKAYGAWGTKTMYGKATTGVIRTTAVIDSKGRIAKIFSNVKVDGHTEKVLAALDALK